MSQDRDVEAIAEEISDLKKRMMQSENGTRITNATIQNSQITSVQYIPLVTDEGDPILDDEGLSVVESAETMVIGLQPDGSNTIVHLTGQHQYTPTFPKADPVVGGFSVTWDGHFMDDPETDIDESREPFADFLRVEVHVGTAESPQQLITGTDSPTRRGTIESTLGGAVSVAVAPGRYWVALVAVNKAGEYGNSSYSVNVEALSMTPEDKDKFTKVVEAANGINHNTFSREAPGDKDLINNKVGDIWFKVNDQNHVIAQWTWTGTIWSDMKLTSAVFAYIDAGDITVGKLKGIDIEGSIIKTNSAPNPRVELSYNSTDWAHLRFYSGSLDEQAPGYIGTDTVRVVRTDRWGYSITTLSPRITMKAPTYVFNGVVDRSPYIRLTGDRGQAEFIADTIWMKDTNGGNALTVSIWGSVAANNFSGPAADLELYRSSTKHYSAFFPLVASWGNYNSEFSDLVVRRTGVGQATIRGLVSPNVSGEWEPGGQNTLGSIANTDISWAIPKKTAIDVARCYHVGGYVTEGTVRITSAGMLVWVPFAGHMQYTEKSYLVVSIPMYFL